MLSAEFVHAWLVAFVLTQCLEAPIYWLAFRHWARPAAPAATASELVSEPQTDSRAPSAGAATIALMALVPSAVTHPLLWFAWVPIWRMTELSIRSYYVIGEGAVLIAEVVILRELSRPLSLAGRWSWRRSLGLALAGNALSYGFGVVRDMFGG